MDKPLNVAAVVVVLFYAGALSHLFSFSLAIGVNYGTTANNLPPPQQVAQFIKDKTLIDRVKIFDANPDIIRAFAGTGIFLTITIPDGEVLNLATPRAARRWVNTNVKPFYPATRFRHICVGSEVFQWTDANTIAHLVPAMKAVHNALVRAGIKDVSVTTAHSLIVLNPSNFPSGSSFKTAWDRSVIAPMLDFHRRTKSPFMVNPYPYFSWSPQKDAFNLFRRNPGVRDPGTGKTYFNMYDFLLDSVHTSMKKLGYGDVEIAVGEVGWPSLGDPGMKQCTVENARWHNLNVFTKSKSGVGTPLMPGRRFETYIFGLFNENLKPGSAAERNFGLFQPDMTPVYNIGIMRGGVVPPRGNNGGNIARPTPSGNQWCVAKPGASDAGLGSALNWACGQPGINCVPVNAGGPCFEPNTVHTHASYVMNAYYKAKGSQPHNCDFSGNAMITHVNPSHGTCQY